MYLRKTKIIATFGPTLKDEKKLKKIIELGVDVIRLNFSHLTPEKAEQDMDYIEQVASSINHEITFLADLKGPEIRLNDQDYQLKEKEIVSLVDQAKITELQKKKPLRQMIGMDHSFLYKIVSKNQIINADDGNFKFKVIEVKNREIICSALIGGILKRRKSLHLSKVDLQLPILSKSDLKNLEFIVKRKFSWIAASFIGKAEQVKSIKKKIQQLGGNIPIISKIESYLGVKNIDEIIDVSEGIMVARGDLGQEYFYEEIPYLQDLIVKKTQSKGKICIIATQLLNSMINDPIPTRSEVTDINLAVKDKVDAVMLSGETASGKYPVKAVEVMNRVIRKTETDHYKIFEDRLTEYDYQKHSIIPVCQAALALARSIVAKCLIIITEKGRGPVFVSAFRSPEITVVGTQKRELHLRNRLYYSIHSILIENESDKILLLKKTTSWLKTHKIIKKGDKIVSIYSEYVENQNRIDHICQQIIK